MKANELRIGNIVHSFYISFNFCVEKICKDSIAVSMDNCGIFNERPIREFNGIPITEKWLLKFGFRKDESYHLLTYVKGYEVSMNEHFSIEKRNGGWYCMAIAPNLEIEFVHQLQNLYFALTGKELQLE